MDLTNLSVSELKNLRTAVLAELARRPSVVSKKDKLRRKRLDRLFQIYKNIVSRQPGWNTLGISGWGQLRFETFLTTKIGDLTAEKLQLIDLGHLLKQEWIAREEEYQFNCWTTFS